MAPVLQCTLTPDAVIRIHDQLNCLAKFSETVGLEVRANKITFLALNISKTAYAAFSLDAKGFFDSFTFDAGVIAGRDRFTCQLLNKTLLSAFRSRLADNRNADTPLERCTLRIHESAETQAACRIVVTLSCRHGLSKTHRLTYEPVDVMHALFDPRTVTNRWRIASRVLREYVEYFGPRTEQLDMLARDGKVVFTSFTEKIMDGNEILKQPLETAVSIHTRDFEEIAFEEDVHIVISVKDFKAIVTHAETLKSNISASFSRPARPLQFSYDAPGIHCEFTVMTSGDARSGTAPPASAPVVATASGTAASRQTSIAPSLSARTNPASMPPPPRPGTNISQPIRRERLGQVKSRPPPNSSQQPASDSLFVPMDEDRTWAPADDETEEQEDQLGWDASGEHASQFQATLRDSANRAATAAAPAALNTAPSGTTSSVYSESVDIDSQGLAATQRLSQLHGMFD